ncbi:MAG: ImmA/IrrE family metallo-endopeptidase [Ilumatobacter fluminis]|uniref:ImmA/IrrE family metallo-endopeptidase n=1 Tax=Ilumatobacter fluminis TaxID=467091 RepID=UPI0032EDD05F
MNLNQLRREAILAAEDVLADLNSEEGAKVPVFDLIEDRGIWLSFQPLDRLLGVYQRIGNVAGVAINVARPLAMQRFTAAHELGHHELGHESHVDDDSTIEGRNSDPKELQALLVTG